MKFVNSKTCAMASLSLSLSFGAMAMNQGAQGSGQNAGQGRQASGRSQDQGQRAQQMQQVQHAQQAQQLQGAESHQVAPKKAPKLVQIPAQQAPVQQAPAQQAPQRKVSQERPVQHVGQAQQVQQVKQVAQQAPVQQAQQAPVQQAQQAPSQVQQAEQQVQQTAQQSSQGQLQDQGQGSVHQGHSQNNQGSYMLPTVMMMNNAASNSRRNSAANVGRARSASNVHSDSSSDDEHGHHHHGLAHSFSHGAGHAVGGAAGGVAHAGRAVVDGGVGMGRAVVDGGVGMGRAVVDGGVGVGRAVVDGGMGMGRAAFGGAAGIANAAVRPMRSRAGSSNDSSSSDSDEVKSFVSHGAHDVGRQPVLVEKGCAQGIGKGPYAHFNAAEIDSCLSQSLSEKDFAHLPEPGLRNIAVSGFEFGHKNNKLAHVPNWNGFNFHNVAMRDLDTGKVRARNSTWRQFEITSNYDLATGKGGSIYDWKLQGANMIGGLISGHLEGVNMNLAYLEGVTFRNVRLSNATRHHKHTSFKDATLVNTTWQDVELSNMRFNGAIFKGDTVFHNVKIDRWGSTFKGAKIEMADGSFRLITKQIAKQMFTNYGHLSSFAFSDNNFRVWLDSL